MSRRPPVLPGLLLLLVLWASQHKQLRSLVAAEEATCDQGGSKTQSGGRMSLEEDFDYEEVSTLQLSSGLQSMPFGLQLVHSGNASETVEAALLGVHFARHHIETWLTRVSRFMEEVTLFEMSACSLAVAVSCALLHELSWCFTHCPKQGLQPRHRCWMMFLEALLTIVSSIDYAFIIPIAYSLAMACDSGYTLSGIIIGSFSFGIAIGKTMGSKLMVLLPYTTKRAYLVIDAAVIAICQALVALVMNTPALHDSHALALMIVVARVIAGFVSGSASVHLMMVEHVCSPREFAGIENLRPLCELLGLAIGPSVTALMLRPPTATTFLQACANPMIVVGMIWALMSFAISWITPLNLDEVKYTNEPRTVAPPKYSTRHTGEVLCAPPATLTDVGRATLAIHALWQIALCSTSTVSVEIATAFIMQVQYHWLPSSIGYGIGIVYASVFGVCCLISLLRVHVGTRVDKIIGTTLCISGIIGSKFLMDTTGSTWIFVGDALVYMSMKACTVMMINYATWSANERKWHSRSTLLTSLLVLELCCKFTMAPLVKGLLATYGRSAYAAFQVLLTSLALLNFTIARFSTMYERQSNASEFKLRQRYKDETKAFPM